MSPSGAEVIRQIRSSVEEVDPSEVKTRNGAVLLDVRETDEWDAGHIPGAKHIPRGYLESRVEGVVGSDREQRVIIYCASGQRSALAANTLEGAARLRERRLDERRHHLVEGPRLRRRGSGVTDARAA